VAVVKERFIAHVCSELDADDLVIGCMAAISLAGDVRVDGEGSLLKA
jgi:hypothetical protein